MKLIVADPAYAEKNRALLMKERHRGNMVVLVSDENRQSLMRNYYALGNYFVSNGGEFVFSGCFSLYSHRSIHRKQVLDILKKYNVRHRFVTEAENACGGQILLSESGEKLPNDRYNYTAAFENDEQRKAVERETEGMCAFMDTEGYAYVKFADISLRKALDALYEKEKTASDQVIEAISV